MRRSAALLLLVAQTTWAQDGSSEELWRVPDHVVQAASGIKAPAPMLRRAPLRSVPHISAALAELLDLHTGALAAEPLALRITLQKASTPAVRAELMRLGGVFEAELGGVLYASLPADQVEPLVRSGKGIELIEPQASISAQALAGGAGLPDAPLSAALLALQRSGQGGRGVRIGILDFGFSGYAEAGLPAPRAQKAFVSGATVFSGSAHGTECARLIQRIAPEASLLLASVGDGRNAGEGQVLAAAQWLTSQGAQLINISASGYLSALDGSAALDQLIGQQTQQGSLWIAAAGNQAQLHWRGKIQDADRNGWVDVGATAQGDLLVFEVTRAGPVTITLNWTPWSGAAADLDAFLYAVGPDGRSELLAQADGVQVAGAVRPVESFSRLLQPGYYLLGLRATRLAAAGDVNVFVTGAARLSPARGEGSVGSPGTALAALTVGAASEAGASASYSARGPTEDGRVKPELLALVPVTGFVGTSAAAPLVTGVAALLQGADPALKGFVLQRRLRQFARPASDSSAAWGLMDLTQGGQTVGLPVRSKF